MTSPARLPFSFARRHSVLVAPTEDGARLYCCSTTPLSILAEVRRHHGAHLQSQVLSEAAFAPQ